MTDEQFLQAVKQTVLSFDPGAEVWLFGSRARGDARPDSDWDFLVLTDKPVDRRYEWSIQDELNALELRTDWVLNAFVYNQQNWSAREATDFYQNVAEDRQVL